MKSKLSSCIALLMIISLVSCKQDKKSPTVNILFLHHSTGLNIWNGKTSNIFSEIAGKICKRLENRFKKDAELPTLIEKYNKESNKNYLINEILFPKANPYGWNNYPYDYYNIWVKNAGKEPYMEEPTLEMLTKNNQLIIFKHCYPVGKILASENTGNINSDLKTIPNYKLQYNALRDKLHAFPDTKFILFTGAVLTKASTTEEEAKRAHEFYQWVRDEWDMPGDNIHLWDLYLLQTRGDIYFQNEYAVNTLDSHPNEEFSSFAANLLFNRIIDIIENNGNGTLLTGESR